MVKCSVFLEVWTQLLCIFYTSFGCKKLIGSAILNNIQSSKTLNIFAEATAVPQRAMKALGGEDV
jgi:hypothetical protein